MESDENEFCPRWYLDGVNNARRYTQQPAKLIKVFDGEETVPALLLSAPLATRITQTLCHGRDYRALEKQSHDERAGIQDRLNDAKSRLTSARYMLETFQRRAEKSDTHFTEDDERRLTSLYKQEYRAKTDLESAEKEEKALKESLDGALRGWQDHWRLVDGMVDQVWMDSGILLPHAHDDSSSSSEDSNEDDEGDDRENPQATSAISRRISDAPAASNQGEAPTAVQPDHQKLLIDQRHQAAHDEHRLQNAIKYLKDLHAAYMDAHDKLKAYVCRSKEEYRKWSASLDVEMLSDEPRDVFRSIWLKQTAALGKEKQIAKAAFEQAQQRAVASGIAGLENYTTPMNNCFCDEDPDEAGVEQQIEWSKDPILEWREHGAASPTEILEAEPRVPDVDVFLDDNQFLPSVSERWGFMRPNYEPYTINGPLPAAVGPKIDARKNAGPSAHTAQASGAQNDGKSQTTHTHIWAQGRKSTAASDSFKTPEDGRFREG